MLVELPGGVRQTNSYDPDGLRVLKADSTGTTKFLWDGQAYLLETDESNVIVAVYAQEPTTYGNVVSQYRLADDLWLPNYYHSDVLGSTSELTDADEEVTDTYQYDAWGELLARTGVTVNPFQWTGGVGYYKDEATGLYYIRQRDYLPRIARWTSTDLLEFVNGMNLYLAYFVPNTTDSSGLSCCGPEMGPNLVLTLIAARDYMNSRPLKKRLMPAIPWPWDISFYSKYEPKSCPTQDCKDQRGANVGFCVEVFRRKQRNFAVNYALFGCLECTHGRNLDISLDIAKAWKSVSGKGSEYDCETERWIYAGYVFCCGGVPLSKSINRNKGENVRQNRLAGQL